AVAAVRPIRSGVVYTDESDTNTGVAFVNPGSLPAVATLILRDAFGTEVARVSQTIEANQHLARFVREFFQSLPPVFLGSLTFESDMPLAAVALRQNRNSRGETLYSAMPVFDANAAASNQPLVFPQIAAGSG